MTGRIPAAFGMMMTGRIPAPSGLEMTGRIPTAVGMLLVPYLAALSGSNLIKLTNLVDTASMPRRPGCQRPCWQGQFYWPHPLRAAKVLHHEHPHRAGNRPGSMQVTGRQVSDLGSMNVTGRQVSDLAACIDLVGSSSLDHA
jgi:hypothetical protein